MTRVGLSVEVNLNLNAKNKLGKHKCQGGWNRMRGAKVVGDAVRDESRGHMYHIKLYWSV